MGEEMTLCPTCGNRMAFHEQYRQWYCPMCNASQIEEALRNQQPADFHYQPSQSFFPGVPTSLQATPQSLEDRSPISGSLYYSMPPASLNQYPRPHQQELAMALAQRYYQIMQQQGGLPIVTDQRQVSQRQIKFTSPSSSPAQDGGVPPQYPCLQTAHQAAPMQANQQATLMQYTPNQYASPQLLQLSAPSPQQPQSFQQRLGSPQASQPPEHTHLPKYTSYPAFATALDTVFGEPSDIYAQEELWEEAVRDSKWKHTDAPWYVKHAPRSRKTDAPNWRFWGAIGGGVMGGIICMVLTFAAPLLPCLSFPFFYLAPVVIGYSAGKVLDMLAIKSEYIQELG